MNKYKTAKIIRVVWGLLALAIFLSIFLMEENIADLAADWQFFPSIIKGFSLLAFGVIVFFIVEALLFGRIFCSFTCPLGVLQDIAIYTGKIFKLSKSRKAFSRNHKVLRYSFLAILISALVLGVAMPLAMFEPFAIFGRVSASHKSLLLLVSGTLVFTALIITASLFGRLFCNTLCPAGAILGLLAKFSWFKFTLNPDACTKCAKCTKVCEANCIDIKNGVIDNERCVTCFNCTAVCPDNAIHYIHSKDKKKTKPDLSKRDFFIIGASALVGATVLPKLLKGTPSPNTVMPPGAFNFEAFTSRCTACQLCVSNCPGNVLKPASTQYGLSGFLQPRLDFDSGFCQFECTTCSNICPNGALKPLSLKAKQSLQIGLAKYTRKNCTVVRDETHCGACAEECPTGAITMVDWQDGLTIPKVNHKLCIGCGACEHVCPAEPDKAIVVSGKNPQTKV